MTIKFRLGAILMTFLFGAASVSRADWVDNFTGGFQHSWIFFDDGGSIPPSTTGVDASGDSLVLIGDPAGLLNNDLDTFVAGLAGLGNPAYAFEDVRLTGTASTFPHTTVVGGGPEQGNNDIFLLARSSGASGYVLSLDFFDGAVDLVRSDNGNVSNLPGSSTAQIANFDPALAYTLELTAIGDQLSGRVLLGNSVLAEVSGVDGTYPVGFAGVGTAVNSNDGIGGPGGPGRTLLAAVFDDVSAVAVPEPSGLTLVMAALLGIAVRRRRA